MTDSLSPTHELESLSEVEQAEFQAEYERIKTEYVAIESKPEGDTLHFDTARDELTGLDLISTNRPFEDGDVRVSLIISEPEDGHALLGAMNLRNEIAEHVEGLNNGATTIVANPNHLIAHDQNNVTNYIPETDTQAALIVTGEDAIDVIDYLEQSGRLSEVDSAVLKDSIEETFGPEALTPTTEPTDPNPPETGMQDANTVNTAATMGLG